MEKTIINGLKRGDQKTVKSFYYQYYNYALSICLRYVNTRDDALELVNDGLMKVITKIDRYKDGVEFKYWMRRIIINTCIDHCRKDSRIPDMLDVSHASGYSEAESLLDKIGANEIVELVQELPPSYKLVFNLYVIEGYKHYEIAQMLGISEGTSKSNLAVARTKLQKRIMDLQQEGRKQYGR